jgi:uncharacterized phiE125 gp8 family phage protein
VWTLSLITPPAVEALDLETEVYPHLRLEPALTPQESLIAGMVATARQRCEEFTQRQLITATWELWLDCWDEPGCGWQGRIYLPRPPLQPQSPTAGVLTVAYVDSAGVEQVLPPDQYIVDAPAGPTCGKGSIFPAYQVIWPTVHMQPGAIKVRYTAGYGASFRQVPAALRHGMLLTIGQLDLERAEQASSDTVNAVRAEGLWFPFRVW